MLGQFSSLGCSSNSDLSCLCGKADFMNGLRDCTNEACPASDKGTVTSFTSTLCSSKWWSACRLGRLDKLTLLSRRRLWLRVRLRLRIGLRIGLWIGLWD
jgi:hypothetical protein